MPMAVRTDAVEALTRAEVERIVEGRSSGAVEYRDDGAANRRCSHGSVRAVMPNPSAIAPLLMHQATVIRFPGKCHVLHCVEQRAVQLLLQSASIAS